MNLRDYNAEKLHGPVRDTFPILCVIDAADVVLEGITVDGNKAENQYIDGCRGGAIYSYRVRNMAVRKCTARNYNGDGISFQISGDVTAKNSESYGNTATGSAHPVAQNCRSHDNGDIGLFRCWRVRHGRFASNTIENKGHYVISIGYQDTDNEFTGNTFMTWPRVACV